jgi:hypothetical protein
MKDLKKTAQLKIGLRLTVSVAPNMSISPDRLWVRGPSPYHRNLYAVYAISAIGLYPGS